MHDMHDNNNGRIRRDAANPNQDTPRSHQNRTNRKWSHRTGILDTRLDRQLAIDMAVFGRTHPPTIFKVTLGELGATGRFHSMRLSTDDLHIIKVIL